MGQYRFDDVWLNATQEPFCKVWEQGSRVYMATAAQSRAMNAGCATMVCLRDI